MDKKREQPLALKKIGTWATWWWGVTFLWILIWVWVSRTYYVRQSAAVHNGFFTDWGSALRLTYNGMSWLRFLLLTIIVVWIIGAAEWLLVLKKYHQSYKAAFKDLFLTIRK